MAKRKTVAKKPLPPPISDETAKLLAETAIGIFNWIRAKPERTAGALLVVGLAGAFVGSLTPSPKEKLNAPQRK